MSIENTEAVKKSNQSGDEHRTGSTVAEPDTEIYQDLDRAENDAITPVSGADLAQDLSGMGALFSDEVLKNVHPILKIE